MCWDGVLADFKQALRKGGPRRGFDVGYDGMKYDYWNVRTPGSPAVRRELEGSPPVGLPERLQAHRERARTPDRARAARRFQCFISFSNHELRFVRSCTK